MHAVSVFLSVWTRSSVCCYWPESNLFTTTTHFLSKREAYSCVLVKHFFSFFLPFILLKFYRSLLVFTLVTQLIGVLHRKCTWVWISRFDTGMCLWDSNIVFVLHSLCFFLWRYVEAWRPACTVTHLVPGIVIEGDALDECYKFWTCGGGGDI
jgi:hypothetical protein